jgi:transposase-like protein
MDDYEILASWYAKVKHHEQETMRAKLNVVELAMALYQAGDTYAGIAEYLGMPSQTLHNWIVQARSGRLSVPDPPKPEQPVLWRDRELTELEKQIEGMTRKEALAWYQKAMAEEISKANSE